MNRNREQRYLQAQKFIVVAWIAVALLFIAWKTAEACSAYLDYEYTDGMYRICVYNHLGSRVPVAYNIVSTCPLSIQVPHG